MSNLGMGVMIQMLMGNEESVAAYTAALNKTINSIEMVKDTLKFTFTDGTDLLIEDRGQSCCEHRYLHSDQSNEDLKYWAGATLLGIDIARTEEKDEDYESHDIQFLDVKTSKGVVTFSAHNEHNGYYGGFALTCSRSVKPETEAEVSE